MGLLSDVLSVCEEDIDNRALERQNNETDSWGLFSRAFSAKLQRLDPIQQSEFRRGNNLPIQSILGVLRCRLPIVTHTSETSLEAVWLLPGWCFLIPRMTSRTAPFLPSQRKLEVSRHIVLAAPDAIDRGGITPFQQQTVKWTGPVEELFGYRLGTIEQTEDWWLNHIHPEDRPELTESLSKHLDPTQGSPFASEARIWGSDYRFRHADGHWVLVSDRSITSRDDEGHAVGLTSVIFDKNKRAVERQQHQKTLHSQNTLALIANNTPSGIFMMDVSILYRRPDSLYLVSPEPPHDRNNMLTCWICRIAKGLLYLYECGC